MVREPTPQEISNRARKITVPAGDTFNGVVLRELIQAEVQLQEAFKVIGQLGRQVGDY
jgi:hypothetical protein